MLRSNNASATLLKKRGRDVSVKAIKEEDGSSNHLQSLLNLIVGP